MSVDIDWAALRSAAAEAAVNAYAPYSGLHVGAAALTDDGRIITGVNVENASFGLTLCAEVSLIGGLVTGGGGRLVALVATDENGRLLSPCGRCRQILLEMGGPDLAVNETWTAATLLPGAFVADDIPADPSAQ
ncbi:MAG: cytidine deaminase [Acidimicrobiales bacterium]